MAYNEFNRTNVKQLRNELDAILQEFADKNNLKIDLGNISFDNASVKCKNFSIGVKGAVSPTMIRISKQLGFKGSAYGQTFENQGQSYTITSLKPHNKRQIIAVTTTGQSYAFPKRMVETAAPELFI